MAKQTLIRRVPDTGNVSPARQIRDLATSEGGFSVMSLLRRLPNIALIPGLVGLFALLLVDLAVADPIPFVDEAAIFYLLVNSLRVLGERRKALRATSTEGDPEVVADVYPEMTTVTNEPISASPM